MPAESTIKLNVVTTADTAGLAAATQATQVLENQTKQLNSTVTSSAGGAPAVRLASGMDAVAKSADKAKKSTDEMKGGLVGNAQAMLQLSRGAQDAQYGIAGMVNNVEGLVMALGGGAGLAGALTLAFVGLDILLKNTDLFGKSADDAKKKLEDMADESRKAADAAAKVAEQTKESTEAQEGYQDALESVTNEYKNQIDASAELRKAREQEIRLAQIEGDAKAELAMAQTEESLARGAISPAEAESRRAAIARESQKRKFETDQQMAKVREAELIRNANAERTAAAGELTTASRLQGGAEGLLTPDERKEAQERLQQRQAELELAKQRSQAAQKEIVRGYGPGGIPDIGESQKLAKKQEDAKAAEAEAQRLADEESARIKADEQARARTGEKDPETVRKRVEDLRKTADERQKKAAEASREAARSEAFRTREAGVFGIREQAAELRERTGVITRTSEDDAARQQQAREAAKAVKKSGAAVTDNVSELTAQLLELQRTNAVAIAKLRAHIEEVQAIQQAQKEGH